MQKHLQTLMNQHIVEFLVLLGIYFLVSFSISSSSSFISLDSWCWSATLLEIFHDLNSIFTSSWREKLIIGCAWYIYLVSWLDVVVVDVSCASVAVADKSSENQRKPIQQYPPIFINIDTCRLMLLTSKNNKCVQDAAPQYCHPINNIGEFKL